ncbi:MAG TPA: hypothetical protein VN948_20775 [Terriglobales bacterium]|nr:hypothetical protein [Terriglobales bacterium]
MPIRIFVASILLAASALWAQVAASGVAAATTGPGGGGGAMVTPVLVSGEGYSMGFVSETSANYLRGGLVFSSAYDSYATVGANGRPVSDTSYSIWPTISLDRTRSRLHCFVFYSPGYTFYQRTGSLDAASQNFAVDLKYYLSSHVTLSLRDSFQKTSNVLNQPNSDLARPVSGAVFVPNDSLIAPIADVLTNNANATMTYQFSANGMIGASGTFTNLHYPNQAQVPGLYDSSSRGGSAFYNHRLSKMHYIGAAYQYQMFLAYPNVGQSETQAHSGFLFYTLYLKPTLSISLFGGPQYSDTQQFGMPSSKSWSPATGASMGWQGRLATFVASYSRRINDGGGLSGAVHSNAADASVGRQFTRTLSASIGANYTNNRVLDALPQFSTNGHTLSGNASVERQIGGRLNLQLQYTRLHQSYSGIAAISSTPNRNRAAVTISYQFSRPLGR